MDGITFYLPLFRPFEEGKPLKDGLNRSFKQGNGLPDNLERSYNSPLIGVPGTDNLIIDGFSFENSHVKPFVLKSAIMTVYQRKNIVMTNIVGRNGSVKQYISDGDYDIDISASIVLDDLNSPHIQDMVAFCKAPTAVNVTSDFLLHFGIQSIVISSFKYNQKQGHEKFLKLEITAHSDEPLSLLQYADD